MLKYFNIMENLLRYSRQLVASIKLDFKRYLFDEIQWEERLLGIVGARGIGKTSLVLQYIKETDSRHDSSFYISLDHFSFQNRSLFDVAEDFYISGGRRLFLDEVHRYPDWSVQIKNIYDYFPELQIVFTGSSALQIHKAEADLSRRAAIYHMHEMSLREFLLMHRNVDTGRFSLTDILKNHIAIAQEISQKVQIIPAVKTYWKGGQYPFFRKDSKQFLQQLLSSVQVILENDLMAVEHFSYATLVHIRKILALIAESVPYKPNISELARKSGISRDVLLRIIKLLERADILSLLHQQTGGTGYFTKPEKIYLRNTALMYGLKFEKEPEIGSVRETFFMNQLQKDHLLSSAAKGDFLVDNEYVFEVGGKNKTLKQIASLPNGFLVKDDIEVGYKNVIPLWLFGFLY